MNGTYTSECSFCGIRFTVEAGMPDECPLCHAMIVAPPNHPNCRCVAPDPHPWCSWWRRKFYPVSRVPQVPDAPGDYADCIHHEVEVHLSWLDWLRVMFSGRLVVESRIVCEHQVGKTVASSVSYPLPPKIIERKDET